VCGRSILPHTAASGVRFQECSANRAGDEQAIFGADLPTREVEERSVLVEISQGVSEI